MTRLIDRPRLPSPTWTVPRFDALFPEHDQAARRLIAESDRTRTVGDLKVRPILYGAFLTGPGDTRAHAGIAITLDQDRRVRWAAMTALRADRGEEWPLRDVTPADDLHGAIVQCTRQVKQLYDSGFTKDTSGFDTVPGPDMVRGYLREQVRMLNELEAEDVS